MSIVTRSLADVLIHKHSHRCFKGALNSDQAQNVIKALDEANSVIPPFGSGAKIQAFEPGIIHASVSAEAGIVAGKIPKNLDENSKEKALVDVAYRLAHFVNRAAQFGIDSVFISGSYKREEANKLFEDFDIPVVVPYGIENGIGFVERFKKLGVGSNSRTAAEKLFFDADWKAISKTCMEENFDLFEAMRAAPSAMNNCGWRFQIFPNKIRVFDTYSDGALDVGIVMAHATMVLAEMSKSPCILIEEGAVSPIKNAKYYASITY